jgi:hypothetical protein
VLVGQEPSDSLFFIHLHPAIEGVRIPRLQQSVARHRMGQQFWAEGKLIRTKSQACTDKREK